MTRSALVPTLRTQSPLAGLRRRSLGWVEVTAQSVAVTAPSAAMAVTPVLVAAGSGPATVFAYVVAWVVVLLVGTCIAQFARRMVSTGSLYSFTTKGLGPGWSLVAGAALVVAYGLLSMTTLLLSGSYLSDVVQRAGLGVDAGRLVTGVVVVVLGIVATGSMVRGVALSSRVALALEAASLLAMAVVLGVVWHRSGVDVDPALLRPAGVDVQSIGTGVALAITSFVGFESAATLGVEARRPHHTVPRAMLGTALGAGGFYVIAVYVQLSATGRSVADFAAAPSPLTAMAFSAGGVWLAHLVDLGIAASGFACATASATALARLLFTMGREGVLPDRLGVVHPRFGTPYRAVLASMGVITAVPLGLLLLGVRASDAIGGLLKVSAFGYLLAYLLVCLAAPRFLHRIGELTPRVLVASALAVAALSAVLGSYVDTSRSPSDLVQLGVFLVLMVATLAWHQRVAVDGTARVGAYDEVVAGDLFDPTTFRAG